MSEVRVWCLRHAESENVTARIAGAVPRPPLTARGRHQAVDVMRMLRDEPITGIYCSTALRAQQTAAPLASDRDIDITALSDLNEVGIGEHEGTADPAVRRHTAEVLRAWIGVAHAARPCLAISRDMGSCDLALSILAPVARLPCHGSPSPVRTFALGVAKTSEQRSGVNQLVLWSR
ncbi:hypothetical protein NBRGN_015_00410 [Nocardia brasiliensis NBRC 14402]|uniref:histidine phosphatase family protein n=1 Tax=Nocardia brasiliensis TaxID=37326 RepID=UPI00045D2C38|nr:histidine phosphatase family protein [Nocardia brasiliensis]GAJ79539.1 hypothetical protein NBRGN_015_00410 [Nocardia brasiliensis NBRC 14402]